MKAGILAALLAGMMGAAPQVCAPRAAPAVEARTDDHSTTPEARGFAIYQLQNAAASDMTHSLQIYLIPEGKVYQNHDLLQAVLDVAHEVVVVVDPVTKKLLISSSPKYYLRVMNLIRALDANMPYIVIQIRVSEVGADGKENFLTRPTRISLENQGAEVFVRQGPGPTNPFDDFQQAGILFQVTPKINPEGRVVMHLSAQRCTLPRKPSKDGEGNTATGVEKPPIETTVEAKTGEKVTIDDMCGLRLVVTARIAHNWAEAERIYLEESLKPPDWYPWVRSDNGK
jgi:type II secretory pathway component GspD/PulD (secretin)